MLLFLYMCYAARVPICSNWWFPAAAASPLSGSLLPRRQISCYSCMHLSGKSRISGSPHCAAVPWRRPSRARLRWPPWWLEPILARCSLAAMCSGTQSSQHLLGKMSSRASAGRQTLQQGPVCVHANHVCMHKLVFLPWDPGAREPACTHADCFLWKQVPHAATEIKYCIFLGDQGDYVKGAGDHSNHELLSLHGSGWGPPRVQRQGIP